MLHHAEHNMVPLLGYNNYIQILRDRIKAGIFLTQKSRFPNKIKKKEGNCLLERMIRDTIILGTMYVHFIIKYSRSLGENSY